MHAIFGDRFVGVREPAWHKLGTVIPEPVGALEALQIAKMDYTVVKADIMASSPDHDIYKDIPDTKATFIAPDENIPEPIFLGTVSKGYQILQNKELAQLLEPLNDKWPIETLGAIKEGAISWFLLEMSNNDILAKTKSNYMNENVKTYLLCSTGHDGKTGINITMTRTRVVCWNTWNVAINNSELNYEINHRGDVKAKATVYLDLINSLETTLSQINDQDSRLASTKIDEPKAMEIINAGFPLPRKPKSLLREIERQTKLYDPQNKEKQNAPIEFGKETVKRYLNFTADVRHSYETEHDKAQALRAGAITSYERINTEYPEIANTTWSAFQAVTEIANWRNGPNADRAVLFGSRKEEMDRAYAKSLQLAKA